MGEKLTINHTRPWRRGWERLVGWLPVLMMALFAIATGWLVRSMPDFSLPVEQRPLTHEPDYRMRHFSVRNFDASGRLKSELKGIDGRHFPDTDTLEVSEPRMRAFDERGQLTVGHADRGVSNHDGSEIRLYGAADVVRQAQAQPGGASSPRLQLRSDYLHVLVEARQVDSDQPVEMLRDGDRFTANSFDYDDRAGVANLRGKVRGTIQSKKR